jgi:DNA ligase-1
MKPLLAAAVKDTGAINYPVLVSPKLDGIRCIIKDGQVLSRSLKPIPNRHVQQLFGRPELEGLDGELIVGDPTDPHCFSITTSAVMSHEGEPDVVLHVFDVYNQLHTPFHIRIGNASAMVYNAGHPGVSYVEHYQVSSEELLLAFEQHFLDQGYEGLMVRSLDGEYKHGRSTLKQGILLKLKRFVDSEATVVDVEERMHNENEAKVNALGQTERSSHKEGQVPAGDLGALHVQDLETGIRFKIGTGFTAELRATLWAQRDTLLGKVVKYKSFPVGVKEAPRFPVFLGFRDKRDMS